MVHKFSVEVAQRYGIEEAILLENLYFWCMKNQANGRHIYDGKAWTYNSVKAFKELFPYMTPSKIRRALLHLEEEGLIVSGNYNEIKYDRTTWYAVTELANPFFKMENGNEQKEKTIPVNNTDSKPSEEKKEKENAIAEAIDSYTDNEQLRKAILEFVEYRRNSRNKMSVLAVRKLLNTLKGFSVEEQIEAINVSIMSGWAGVFPRHRNEQQAKGVGKVAHKSEEYDDDFDENGEFKWEKYGL